MKEQKKYTKPTFSNLPEEKQARIREAAVKEFAEQGYRRASLNTIVNKLGIAKGSLYQYFENKEALFLFVFHQFTKQVKITVREATDGAGECDFFELVRIILLAGIQFISEFPLYYQIYLKVLFEDGVPRREQLLAKVRLFSFDYFGPLCEEAQQCGTIRADIPAGEIIFIIDAVLDRFFQVYAGARTGDAMLMRGEGGNEGGRAVTAIMKVLRNGLLPGNSEMSSKGYSKFIPPLRG